MDAGRIEINAIELHRDVEDLGHWAGCRMEAVRTGSILGRITIDVSQEFATKPHLIRSSSL